MGGTCIVALRIILKLNLNSIRVKRKKKELPIDFRGIAFQMPVSYFSLLFIPKATIRKHAFEFDFFFWKKILLVQAGCLWCECF